MEILKLIYLDEGLFANEVLFFAAKVNDYINNNLGFNYYESFSYHVLFNKYAKNKNSFSELYNVIIT